MEPIRIPSCQFTPNFGLRLETCATLRVAFRKWPCNFYFRLPQQQKIQKLL